MKYVLYWQHRSTAGTEGTEGKGDGQLGWDAVRDQDDKGAADEDCADGGIDLARMETADHQEQEDRRENIHNEQPEAFTDIAPEG